MKRFLLIVAVLLALAGTAGVASPAASAATSSPIVSRIVSPGGGSCGALCTGSCTYWNIGEVRGSWPYDYQCQWNGLWVSWRYGVIGD